MGLKYSGARSERRKKMCVEYRDPAVWTEDRGKSRPFRHLSKSDGSIRRNYSRSIGILACAPLSGERQRDANFAAVT